ncbi:hypothetical protein N5U55_09095 [Aliarcobacter butzleri]|uniref:hypothetical protein n=1 Tax=Aliarcobacter butzleri TaxID=28197 RepID=UPI0021B289E2|nr:hypothetical protein [Aliarcobacter butzleri]MCT7584265.1 hypothetical protein [Aliarcobacter butzleri]
MAFNIGDLVLKKDSETVQEYIRRVYEVFKNDFIDNKPNFCKKVGLKRHPLRNDREATFWHFTTEGEIEDEREIDISRCERIKYPKNIIENFNDESVKCWKNERKGNTNILLYFEAENYLVVLSDRGEYVLPWTAYIVNYKNQREKLLKEYEKYKKMADDAIC